MNILREAKLILADFDADPAKKEALLNHASAEIRRLAQKHLELRLKEEARLDALTVYEQALYDEGLFLVAGLDEAGRGPLCGPVVAAAVILPPHARIWGLDDSKKLSPAKREELERRIKEKALFWAVAGVNNRLIDKYNILQAAYMAMKKALFRLPVIPQHLLLDALILPGCGLPQTSIVKGDAKSVSIAAASILAKCHRDRVMERFAQIYPQYSLEKHKGYPTAEHCQSIVKNGYSPIHRRSFKVKGMD